MRLTSIQQKTKVMKEFIYSTKWCELVFENRNKKYGAYQIRMREADNTIIAWFTSAFFMLALVGTLAWMGGPSKEFIKKFDTKPKVNIIFDTPPTQVLPPMDIPQPPAVSSTSKIVEYKYQITDKKIDNTKVLVTPISPVITPITGGIPGTGPLDVPVITGAGAGGVIQPPNANAKNIVDVMPAFPGGEKALLDYLSSHIRYPQELVEIGVTGIVYLGFVIGSDGKVYDIKVMKGVNHGEALAQEAQRVVGNMPIWTPGIQGGQNVAVNFVLPVNFITR